MDACEVAAVKGKYVYLVENLDMNHIIDHIFQRQIIDENQMDLIERQQTTRSKTKEFLKILLQSQQRGCFQLFCEALRAAQWGWAADTLQSDLLHIRSNPALQPQDFLTKLPAQARTRSLSMAEVAVISRNIGEEWQCLGQLMGFPPGRLQQMQMSHQYDVSGAILKMLQEWIQRHPGRATVDNFVSMCRKAGISEDAYKQTLLENAGYPCTATGPTLL